MNRIPGTREIITKRPIEKSEINKMETEKEWIKSMKPMPGILKRSIKLNLEED